MAINKRQVSGSTLRNPPDDDTITVRVPTRTRALIDSAAATIGKSRTEFLLDSARQNAINVLLDQRLFSLDAETSEIFVKELIKPVAPNMALSEMMSAKAPWD